MAKLRDRLLYGDYDPTVDRLRRDAVKADDAQPDIEDEESVDGEYGVGRRGDEVVISLGPIPPFQVPKDTAIKLAALLLKQAGCDVVMNSVDRKLTAKWGRAN